MLLYLVVPQGKSNGCTYIKHLHQVCIVEPTIPVTRVSNDMMGVQIINLGQWPSPHSHHQCTLVAEALVIIPVATAMGTGTDPIESFF